MDPLQWMGAVRMRVNECIFNVLNENNLQLYFWYSKLVYLKSAKLEQQILYLMYFNCADVVL